MSNLTTTNPSQDLAEIVRSLQVAKDSLDKNIDIFFVVTVSMIIFLMQCGFAFLEAGAVRSKNTTNILLKNLLDSSVAGLSYWAFGYAFAFGSGGPFIGGSGFFGNFADDELSKWFFQMVFAATAATIVSGGVAERCEFIAYLTYSIVLTAFCYPVVTRWAWHENGWLADGFSVIEGAAYQDFAGSGVVHLCGGVAALFGALFLGPRIGRFDENGKDLGIPGHSVPLAALGGFILMFGFFAFNGGSQFTISGNGDGVAVAKAIVNTMISGSSAGVTTILLHRILTSTTRNCFVHSTWSLLATINGVLTGMVAICAGANTMQMWGAFVTGLIAAFIYYFGSILVAKCRIDDPLDAVAVHGLGGSWGLIAAPLLSYPSGIIMTGSSDAFKVLAMNLIGWLAIVAWTSVIVVPMFGLLKLVKLLRVDPEIELKGLDIPKHGEPAYPSEAWGDGWGDFLKSSSQGLDGAVTDRTHMISPLVVASSNPSIASAHSKSRHNLEFGGASDTESNQHTDCTNQGQPKGASPLNAETSGLYTPKQGTENLAAELSEHNAV